MRTATLLVVVVLLWLAAATCAARRTSERLGRYREFYLRCRTPFLSESMRAGLMVNWKQGERTGVATFTAAETEGYEPREPEFPAALVTRHDATLHSCYTEERVNAGALTGPDEPDVETQARKVLERLTDWRAAVKSQRDMRSYYSVALVVLALTLLLNATCLAVTLVVAQDPQALECGAPHHTEESPHSDVEAEEEEEEEDSVAAESPEQEDKEETQKKKKSRRGAALTVRALGDSTHTESETAALLDHPEEDEEDDEEEIVSGVLRLA